MCIPNINFFIRHFEVTHNRAYDQYRKNNILIFILVTTTSSPITLTTAEQFHAISSPNYPGNYPNDVDRTFIIRTPVGSSVKLVILDLSIESSCSYDTLRIYDGKYEQRNAEKS